MVEVRIAFDSPWRHVDCALSDSGVAVHLLGMVDALPEAPRVERADPGLFILLPLCFRRLRSFRWGSVAALVAHTMLQTMDVAASRRRDRPDVTDVKFVIRKDDRKMQRVRYLLDMQAHIQTATKDGKNLTAAYAEEAAAAALATSGAPGGPAAAGSKGAHPGAAGAAGASGSGSGGKGVAPPLPGSGAAGGTKPVEVKVLGGGGVGGSGKASAFKPPPAPR